jgi:lysophospholipase L1-like esterase
MALRFATCGSMFFWLGLATSVSLLLLAGFSAAAPAPGTRWVVSWLGSGHGPYPAGNGSAQPDLTRVFPRPAAGAHDQSFRLIVRPELWGCQARLRLSNAFGSQPVTFADVHVGLQLAGPALVAGTNRPVAFAGKSRVTVAPGQQAWSDPIDLPFACAPASAAALAGRKLAVSFHVPGQSRGGSGGPRAGLPAGGGSGPMTWHAKALQTSYLTAPGGGSRAAEEGEAGFPFSTTSWFFLDAVEVKAPADAHAVVAFGDSITDGTNSTLNGDDRWPDVLGRRLRAAHGDRVAVVNAGIGGNQVRGPAQYSLSHPVPGGPSALDRLERDVLSLSGVGAVIWFEGINDFGKQNDASAEAVIAGLQAGVARMRARLPGVRVLGATVTTALGSDGNHGHAEEEARRQALNAFIRTSGLFDGVLDFDRAVVDPATGRLRPEMAHNTTVGGAGDGIHPNRLGYLAMAMSVDLALLAPPGTAAEAERSGKRSAASGPQPRPR